MGTFMTKHCGSALRYGSPMKQEDPDKEKKKITEAEYVDRELTKRMKKKKMTPEEVLAATKSIKGLYKQENLGN